ncbi:MAG: ATP-binding protein [Clostridia bacterium]|nr:ATP-binding protein [Clostridia bacterium]
MTQKIINIWSENMNIKRIKIDGFKNLKDIDLTLNNITSLLSINSYGKTNTLTAIIFGIDFIIGNNKTRKNQMMFNPVIPVNKHYLSKTFSFEIETTINNEEIIYGYSFLWSKNNEDGKIIKEYLKVKEPSESQKFTFYIKRENESSFYKPSKTGACNKSILIENYELILNKIKAYDDLFYMDIIKNLNNLRVFIDHDFNATTPYGIAPILDGEVFNYDLSGKNNIPTILYDIQQKRPDRFNLIINTFTDIFPSIEKIDVVQIPITVEQNVDPNNLEPSKVAGKFYALIAKDKNLSSAIDFNNMSDGAKRILKVLTNLEIASNNGFSIVAIEEPENSLNPKVLQQYLIALNGFAKNIKIIITSHSPYLMNYIEPSKIYVGLPHDNGIATFSKIKDKSVNKLMDDAESLDLRVGDYLFDLMSGDSSDLDTLAKYTE